MTQDARSLSNDHTEARGRNKKVFEPPSAADTRRYCIKLVGRIEGLGLGGFWEEHDHSNRTLRSFVVETNHWRYGRCVVWVASPLNNSEKPDTGLPMTPDGDDLASVGPPWWQMGSTVPMVVEWQHDGMTAK